LKNDWIGKLIKEERAKQGLTQYSLARQAGININTLGTLERGSRAISVERCEKILAVLGYELDAHLIDQ
tara:strand:- start:599 stop:805 length:207 start_codon:yes stop_codon:yes gene_type:complete